MTPERQSLVKRMLASASMVEGVVASLHAGLSSIPEAARKLEKHPTFLAMAVESLLDALVPHFDGMDDAAVQAAIAFQESPAGQAYAASTKGLVQSMPQVATQWMQGVQEALASLPG